MLLKEILKKFNRKERNWLVRDALGKAYDSLSSNFCDRITSEVKRVYPAFEFDEGHYWATDFHFDWLVGALYFLKNPSAALRVPQLNADNLVTGSQEDIDLIVATGNTLLLVEAKGEGAWSNAQLTSKIARLNAMTRDLIDTNGWVNDIRVVFLLCSPRKPTSNLKTKDWPEWALVAGRPLHFPLERPSDSFFAVSSSTGTKPDKDGKQWIIQEIERSSSN